MFDILRRAAVLGLAAGWLGCGETDVAETLPPTQTICDGSDQVRFVFTSFGGFANFSTEFSGKYGRSYLAIDGQCKYWLGSETLSGLRTGTLESHTAAVVGEELHFGRYSTAADYRDPGGCLDAMTQAIDDGTATLSATCLQRGAGPRVYSEAFMRAFSLLEELDAAATADWRRSTLLALRDPPELAPGQPGTPRTPSSWTATLDLEAESVASIDLARGLEPDAGVVVQDKATQALLALLRSSALRRDRYALDLLVRDDRERVYELLVRDEPPDAVRAAIEAAIATTLAP